MDGNNMFAYISGLIVCVIFIGIAILSANIIKFKPDMSHVTKKKIWFWVICVVNAIIAFVVNYFKYDSIRSHSKQDAFMTHSIIALIVINVIVFIISGVVLSKAFNRTKIGDWF